LLSSSRLGGGWRILVLCRGVMPITDANQISLNLLRSGFPLWRASGIRPYCHSKVRPRYRRGTAETRHPPGSGITLKSRGDVNRYSGSTVLSSSGVGNSCNSRRRGVGGTGARAGSTVLGRRVFTASRSASPGGTWVPQAAQVLPPRFTPSQTGQRQIALTAVAPVVSVRACRADARRGASR
jgi:hypothetical protein